MKKTAYLLLAIALFTGGALAAGRLSTISVSENGTVMLATGNPNEFKSSWSGQPGQFQMIIELPGVTVDKTAKVLGNLAANRGIKNVRFSQFSAEPPVARVIIETSERLSYSWSTKPEGVELHFMLPSPLGTPAGTAPTATGFAVPSNAFSQKTDGNQAAQAGETDSKTAIPPSKSKGTKAGSTMTGSKPTPVVSAAAPKTVVSPTSKTTNGSSTKATDSAAKPGYVTVAPPPAGTTGKQAGTTETGKPGTAPSISTTAGPPALAPSGSAPVSDKSIATVKAPTSGPQKESAPTGTISSPQVKAGTTMPAKGTPSAGPSLVPTGGGTGVVVKPSSLPPGQPAPTKDVPVVAEKSKTAAGAPTTTTPTAVKPGTVGTPAVSAPTGKPAGPASIPTEAPKTTAAKPTTGAAPSTGVAATKPAVSGGAADTVNQEKFKEQLKKALGKLETPAPVKPGDAKAGEAGKKGTAPVEKSAEASFQEQLKQALDPAKSLTDTGEVADVDDIDADLPATDEQEEEPYDTSSAFPGGTFMQVSPSRKVIRYHSEGRRDPFSPLTGRDRYASGKKRRAVPAAEQLRLVGIMRSLAGNKAVLEDGEGNGYLLAPGDRVRNGYLVSVSENKVLFQVTEYGWTKTVAMELGNLE